MEYALVFVLAAAAGAAVGVATLRTGQTPRTDPGTWSRGYEPPAVAEPVTAQGATAYVEPAGRQPLPTDPTAQTRVLGVLGLLVVCLLAAGAIVGALYAAYLAVKGMFGG